MRILGVNPTTENGPAGPGVARDKTPRIFCLLPDWPSHRLLELAPLNWKTTRERVDVREALATNVYRAATLLAHTDA